MPVEFQVPSLRIQVRDRLSEDKFEQIWLQQLLELGKARVHSMAILEQEKRRQKAFMDWHRHACEKDFAVGKAVLVFQTRMGQMPGKLRFRWTGPYWIVGAENGMFQLGTLVREVLRQKVNGFRLKPYLGPKPPNPVLIPKNLRNKYGDPRVL